MGSAREGWQGLCGRGAIFPLPRSQLAYRRLAETDGGCINFDVQTDVVMFWSDYFKAAPSRHWKVNFDFTEDDGVVGEDF